MAYEFKWKEAASNQKAASEFTSTYANSRYRLVTPAGFDEFMQ